MISYFERLLTELKPDSMVIAKFVDMVVRNIEWKTDKLHEASTEKSS